MNKNLCLTILIVLASIINAFSQSKETNFQSLVENCCIYLERQDSLSFVKTLPQLYGAYLKENDTYYAISQELEKIQMEDQSIRLLYLNIPKNKTNLINQIKDYMNELDKQNGQYALSVLRKHGWLTTDEISERANETLFLIVQHSNDKETQSLCLNLLKEKLPDYPAEKWHYAFLTDRFAMNQGQEQVYGTQKIIKKGIPYVIPLKFPEKVDSLRAEMGLSSLWNELNEEYDCNWNLEEYFRNLPKIKQIYKEYYNKHH